jgi:heme-degrading monooxygenase HmoA
MTVVKINAISVREGSGDELARPILTGPGRWTTPTGSRASSCFQPTDQRDVWLVVTRWRDEDSFNAWVNSPAFAHGHRSAPNAGTRGTARRGSDAPPVGAHSELWSYDIVDLPSP